MHGYGWWMSMRQGDEKPKVTRELLLRPFAMHADTGGTSRDAGDDHC
jgi:hypothetical protein